MCNTLNPGFIAPNRTNLLPQGSFLAKTDPAGNLLWSKSIGTNGYFYGVAADASGNVYVTGTPNVENFTRCNLLLSKYDPKGNLLWSVQSQGDLADEGLALTVDAATNIYVSGEFSSTNFTLGSITITNNEAGSPLDLSFHQFVAKFDGAGNALWVKPIYGSDISVASPRLDPAGDVIVAGVISSLTNLATFGTSSLTNIGAADLFVASHDPAGNLIWAQHVGAGDFSAGTSISVDLTVNIYLGTQFQSLSATFGNMTLTNQAGTIVLVKCDGNGSAIWNRQVKSLDGGDYDSGGVFADAAGNIYQTGSFDGSRIDFGGLVLPTANGQFGVNVYVAKYDGAGHILWAQDISAVDSVQSGCVSGDVFGNIFLAGNFSNVGIFGSASVTAANPNEIYVAKIDGPQLGLRKPQAARS